MPRYVAKRSESERAVEVLARLSKEGGVAKKNTKPPRVARPIRYEPNTDTRRDRLLKRLLGIVRKTLALARIAGEDFRFALAIACRDPRCPDKGYNCFASSSEAGPVETLAEWTRRLEIDVARPEDDRQFSLFGPDRDPNRVPPTLNSFFHKSLLPDREGRGFRDGDREDEEIWETLQAERAIPSALSIEAFPVPFEFAPRAKKKKRAARPLQFAFHDPLASDSSSDSSTPSVSVEFDDASSLDFDAVDPTEPPRESRAASPEREFSLGVAPREPRAPRDSREFLLGVASFLRASRSRTLDAARAFQ